MLVIISGYIEVDGGGDSDSNTGQLCVALSSQMLEESVWWLSLTLTIHQCTVYTPAEHSSTRSWDMTVKL